MRAPPAHPAPAMSRSPASVIARFIVVPASLLLIGAPVGAAQGASPAARPVWPDEGPLTWTTRTTEQAITATVLRTHQHQIAHDSIRGRQIGEPRNTKTSDYIASEFQRL